ncbi:motility associated factor glycosyltransferase family protein [Lutibacter sp. B2]|nr:motility associated factor glycosyltransferase family protein [Lutibacter sp. B2]
MSKKRKNFFQNKNNKKPNAAFPMNNKKLIYTKNMTALRKRYSQIAELMERTPIDYNYRIEYTGVKKTANIFCANNNMYYYNENNPLQDAREQVDALKLKNARLAVFLGFGLGYEAKYFIDHLVDKQKTAYILIIEKDPELFKMALTVMDLTGVIENEYIELMVGIDENKLFPICADYFKRKMRIVYLKTIKPIYHLSSLQLYKEYYLNSLKILRESGVFALNFFGNDPEDSLIGVENMLDNIEEIVLNPGIKLLCDKFKGKPAVIASTGPSLNKNKHLLKGLEDKALIICPDASLRILLDTGVKPHMVTSLERITATVELLKGYKKEEVEDVYYAACPVVMNEAYESYPGPRVIVYRNFDHFKWLGIDRGILDIKHSSGNMAFKIAEALGCDPIILVGQDLAYSRDGKTHASGTLYGEIQEGLSENLIEVKGNDGQPILTNPTWNEFRQAYEVDVAQYKGTCINSTEGGAFINGTQVMPFQESIDLYINKKIDPLQSIKEYLSEFSSDEVDSDIKNVEKLINDTIEDLEAMIEDCNKGYDIYLENKSLLESYIIGEYKDGKGDSKLIKKIQTQLSEPKNRIISKHRTMQLFLMHIIQSFNIKFEMDLKTVPEKYEYEEMALAEILLSQRKWYKVIHDIIAICLKSLNKAKEKLTAIQKKRSEEIVMYKYVDVIKKILELSYTVFEGFDHIDVKLKELRYEEAFDILSDAAEAIFSIEESMKPFVDEIAENQLKSFVDEIKDLFKESINIYERKEMLQLESIIHTKCIVAYKNWQNELIRVLGPYMIS